MSAQLPTDIQSQLDAAQTTGILKLRLKGVSTLPTDVRRLTNLRVLHVEGDSIRDLPEWLSELTLLEHLVIANTSVERLPSTVGGLRSLRTLGASTTHLSALDDEVRDLASLEVLTISNTAIKLLPSWIGELKKLRVLDMGFNRVPSLPDSLASLSELTHLYLWGHHLREFPSVLLSLSRLEMLDLSSSGSEGIPQDLPGRGNLFHQHVEAGRRMVGAASQNNGQIAELPDTLHTAFPALKTLHISGQSLRALPHNLPPRLESLYLGQNRIGEVAASALATDALRTLDLHDNDITEVPSAIASLAHLAYLNLIGNDLSIPPEILAEPTSPRKIIEYAEQVRGPRLRLDQAKLLVVGEGSVGKTSLIRRLVFDEYSAQERKTDGIDVCRWHLETDGDPVGLNVWDFGGQEIMHATHQFFLTKRSAYILVTDARQGEEQNRIEYWLKLIQSFAEASPVIIAVNKTEQAPMDVDSRGLKTKYKNIVDVVPISCETAAGIPRIKELLRQSISEMKHVRDLLPQGFFEVKHDLEESKADYMTFDDYSRLCISKGVVDGEAQELLVSFLHDLGTVLCFRDDPRLADTNILNPEWVTGGVYRLLNANLAAQRKGLLSWKDANVILDMVGYPPERRTFIIEMMKRFELCYESEGVFLIPDLMTKQEPDTGTWDDALFFEVKFDVLPSSIMSRLIVRMRGAISRGTVWRTGVVLAMDGNRALVKGDREDAVVRIAVSGPLAGRRGLLTAIRSELRAVASTIPGLTVEERVPVPGHADVWVPYAHLLDLEAVGRHSVVPQGVTEDFDIHALLDGVEQLGDRLDSTSDNSVSTRRTASDAALMSMSGRPWTPTEAIRFGGVMIGAVLMIAIMFTGVEIATGPEIAAGITSGAVVGMLLIAILVLRASGRISEDGMLETVRHLVSGSQ
jgi:internalin A